MHCTARPRRRLQTHLAVSDAQGPQMQVDLGAGLGIRPGVVVVERYAEMLADMVELLGRQGQAAPCALERA